MITQVTNRTLFFYYVGKGEKLDKVRDYDVKQIISRIPMGSFGYQSTSWKNFSQTSLERFSQGAEKIASFRALS